MNNKLDKFEDLLQEAMLEEDALCMNLINQTRERLHGKELKQMKLNHRKPLKWVASIAAGLLITSLTAFATWQLLTPSDVANEFEHERLAMAFESDDAIQINESITSDGYIFTLLAMVSGEGLSDTLVDPEGHFVDDRTYAVLAIEQEDGTSMYGSTSTFFSAVYVGGFKPWQVNSVSLVDGMGSRDVVVDGVFYRIIDMANLEVLADHNIYLGVSLGRFSFDAFDFDIALGTLDLNPDFNGPAVLFELPLDPSLANAERAQEILDEIFSAKNDEETIEADGDGEESIDWVTAFINIDENGEEITTRLYPSDFVEMTYEEVADLLTARIERDIANGEPEAVISGARRDREDTLRRMRDYNIEFAQVWYDDNGISISLIVPGYEGFFE